MRPASVALFKTTPYGGIKRYQWATSHGARRPNRQPSTAGTSMSKHRFAPGDPVFVIPDAAPHSDRLLRNGRTPKSSRRGDESRRWQHPGLDASVADQVMTALRQRFKIHDEDLVAAELDTRAGDPAADVGSMVACWNRGAR